MALFVCGVALRKYNHSNLSPASRAASVELLELLAVVAEDLVFLYMGASVWDADFREQLAKACPDGIDVYFENVGGETFDAVMELVNDFARIPVCGRIAHDSDTAMPEGPDRLPGFMGKVLVKRLLIKGFIQFDYIHRQGDFLKDMPAWIRDGKVKYQEDVVEGLENAVSAFQGLLQGKNRGKLLIQVGDDPTKK